MYVYYKMAKTQILKEARTIITELIDEAKLDEDQSIEVKYKDAYIRLHRSSYFGDEMIEYRFDYSKIINDRIYEITSFCYDKFHSNKVNINDWYFDKNVYHKYRQIKPWMNLKNLIFKYPNFRDKTLGIKL